MPKVKHNNCCVAGCLNNNGYTTNLTFYPLPMGEKRRNDWLKRVGRTDLLSKPDLKYYNYQICSKHFEDCYVRIFKKLHVNAVPTRHLPTSGPEPPDTSWLEPPSPCNSANSMRESIQYEDNLDSDDEMNVLTFKPQKDVFVADAHTQTEPPRLSRTEVVIFSENPMKRERSPNFEVNIKKKRRNSF